MPCGCWMPAQVDTRRPCCQVGKTTDPECAKRSARSFARAQWRFRLCRMRCGASSVTEMWKRKSSAPHGAERHPPLAAAERAALRSARSFARASGGSGSAGCGAEPLPSLRCGRGRAPRRMEQSAIRHWRQQSVPHSGVREALLAPCGGSGSAGCGAEHLPSLRCGRGRTPRHMEQSIHPPLAAAERAAVRARPYGLRDFATAWEREWTWSLA